MFVLFISFIFVLIVSVGRTTETKHLSLKEKLAKSLTHLKDLLVEIDAKIEHERTLLSQIDNLHNTDGPAIARMNNEEVTDISGQSSPPVAPKTTEPTVTDSPFIQDLKKVMAADRQNYFTAFLARFMELMAIKDPAETIPVIHLLSKLANDGVQGLGDVHKHFLHYVVRVCRGRCVDRNNLEALYLSVSITMSKLNDGVFDNKFAERLIMPLKFVIAMVGNMTASKLNEQASAAFFRLKNNDTILPAEYASVVDFFANLFTKEEDGELLFQALEGFAEYPKEQKTATQVSNMMLHAVLRPYMRIKGTKNKEDTLCTKVEKTHLENISRPEFHFGRTFCPSAMKFDLPPTVQPQRRSMNLKPSNKHHRFFKSYKQKPDKKYSKNRDEHLNEPEQPRRRAYVPSEEDYNNSEYFQDSIKNDKLHKIREASSYSDETDQLRNNVYDALRHGNMTFEAFRKSGGDVNNKQALRVLSNETDNEWVIKNNIYKVFEQEEKYV